MGMVCIGLLPRAQAACDSPDPGCPGGNLAEGYLSLAGLASGAAYNTGIGAYSLLSDTTGGLNTGVGAGTLFSNLDAIEGTAVGAGALFSSNAANNTAVGAFALFSSTTGEFNNAVGANSLLSNVDGSSNNALGESALFSNIHASANTALGDVALPFNDSDGLGLANNNTAVGGAAMFNNVDGSENTVVGRGAAPNLIAGFNNTYVGDFVGSVDPIGNPLPDESSTIRIGDLSDGNGAGSLECFIGGIFNNFQPVGGTVVEVTLDLTNDKLGWDVGPNQGGSVPVQRGAPVPRSAPGAPTQRPAMLNGKVGRVEKLEATVAQQQKQIETLTAQLREQAAQIQKVSAQLEAGKPAPQVVNNP